MKVGAIWLVSLQYRVVIYLSKAKFWTWMHHPSSFANVARAIVQLAHIRIRASVRRDSDAITGGDAVQNATFAGKLRAAEGSDRQVRKNLLQGRECDRI